jgi:LPXTG-motif cell wall-anchored protein
MEVERVTRARVAGFDLAALPSGEQELVMKMRFVFRALTVVAMTGGLTAGTSILWAQDHQDPYVAGTSPRAVEPVQQTSPQPIEVIEQTSPQAVQQTSPEPVVNAVGHSERDPYIAETSPKPQKVSHHKNDYGLPKGHITIVGCFYRDIDSDGDHAKYLLADAKMGPATTVASQDCVPTGATQMIKLKDADDSGLNQVPSNRWVEIFGEMGKAKDADDQRRFEVESFREVPLTPRAAVLILPIPVAPKVAVETPAPEPAVETPEPVATAGIETPKELPKTASELPLIALLGLFALSGGAVLGLLDRRRALGRG